MAKNINHLQHIKSNVVVEGKPKLPQASSIVEGELAINYAEGLETISLKNSSGNVVTFSSDNYYTEQKLGSGFTGVNSANTVTSVIDENEKVVSQALNDLNVNKLDVTAYTPTDLTNYYTKSETSGKTEISTALGKKVDTSTFTAHTASTSLHFSGTEKANLDSLATNIATISGITSSKVSNWDSASTNSHTHSNKATLDAITASSTAINSLTGAVGTMAFQNASSYSSATQVNTALSGKSATGHTHDDRYYTESELTGSSTTVVVAKASSASTAASANSVALSNVTGADDLKAIEALAGTSGLLKKTAANTWTLDTNSYSTTAVAVTGATYNSTDKTIDLKNAAGTVVSTVDATAFIKDGMVSNVEVKNVASSGTCLVITFNTDAGKDAINIPISQIFDASNYYTKSDLTASTSTVVVKNASSASTAASANSVALSNVTGADDLKVIEGLTGTSGLLKKTAANTWSLDTTSYVAQSTFNTHTANTSHMTTTEKTNLDSLATNIATISGITSTKVSNWDSASTNSHTHSNKETLDAITATSTAINSLTGAVGTMAFQNASSYSSATQVNTALAGKSDTGHTHDDRYYTESELTGSSTTVVVAKASSASTAASANSVALSNVTGADDIKAIEGLTGTSGLLKKTAANTWSLDTTSYSSATQVNTALAGKSDTGHTHDDRYYTESELTGSSTTVVVAKAASATTAASAGSVAWSNVSGKPSSFTPSAHNQASNTITAMTDYAKASTASAIASGDTLNTAIGKLEKALDGKGTVTKVSTASGLTGGDITTTGTIGLAATGTSGTYGPTANVTGTEGATIKIPQITTDTYGRVTSVTERTYTSKNSTYTVNNGTFAISGNGTSVASTSANASANSGVNIKPGSNVSITTAASEITIAATDTTYSAGTAAQLSAGTNTYNGLWSAKNLKDGGNAIWQAKGNYLTGVTLASGTNNGTVKLTVNGSATDNIAVKGLGTAAYKAEGYFAGSGHTHTNMVTGSSLTANNIILGNGSSAIKASSYGIETAVTTTSDALIPTSKAIATYVTSQMASALTYKGAISSNDTLKPPYKTGDVWVVSSAGTYAGKACEVGDYLIANKTVETGTSVVNADWDAINGENQVENKSATLAWNSAVTIATVDGTNITAKLPANPNSNTWRNVKINGTEKLGTGTGTGALEVTSGSTNGTISVAGTDVAVKGLGGAAYLNTGTTSSTVAAGNHTHTTTIASDTGTSQVSLTHGGKFKLTAGGTSYIFTMPSDNNSWRNVTVNGTEKLGTGTNTGSLDFASGSTNGTISVEGVDVKVTGLGGAAYLNTGTAAGTVATGNHNHSGTYATNTFSKVKINAETTTIDADSTGDTLTISGGSFISLTSDATNDKFTIAVSTGTSSSTVARGDHSHSSYVNQNAFSNIKVGSTTVAADTTTDTVEFAVDSNGAISITGDATNDKVTFGLGNIECGDYA